MSDEKKCVSCKRVFEGDGDTCDICVEWQEDMNKPAEARSCVCGETLFREERRVVLQDTVRVPKWLSWPALESTYVYVCIRCGTVLQASKGTS